MNKYSCASALVLIIDVDAFFQAERGNSTRNAEIPSLKPSVRDCGSSKLTGWGFGPVTACSLAVACVICVGAAGARRCGRARAGSPVPEPVGEAGLELGEPFRLSEERS